MILIFMDGYFGTRMDAGFCFWKLLLICTDCLALIVNGYPFAPVFGGKDMSV